MARVACIGECMVELRQAPRGLYSRSFGGDTLNTAVYLARLDVKVDYLTALGDDALSDEMIAAWTAEGVGTRRVLRLPGKLPGLYMIQTDAGGERQFFHWRENSAARRLMDVPETDDILNSLTSYDMVYLSAITLSIYGDSGRERLLAAVKRARLLGTRFVFDTNFRARGWPDPDIARRVFGAALETADIVLASTEDLLALYPGESQADIAARLAGASPIDAAHAGHRLAGLVIGYPGAIIPAYAMPSKKRHRQSTRRQGPSAVASQGSSQGSNKGSNKVSDKVSSRASK